MMMLNGESFVGNSGTEYLSGSAQSVGPADVRQALMHFWQPVEYTGSSAWISKESDPLVTHLQGLASDITSLKDRVEKLEAPVKLEIPKAKELKP